MMDRAPLVRMANQIAANLAVRGEAVAATQTAQHIRDFWDPRMKAAILAEGPAELSPIAKAALLQLRG
jgi:formate dehydrogenase subunit delta